MTALLLSRVRLRQSAPVDALAPLLLPEAPEARIGAAHRLVWSLFAGDPDAKRHFLYREMNPQQGRPGRVEFMILSREPPRDALGLFDVESRPFEAKLAPGDRLGFSLRANPTVDRRAGRVTAARSDVVMDKLYATPKAERAEGRRVAIQLAGCSWLEQQGQSHGFALHRPDETLRIDGYNRITLQRRRAGPITFSSLDIDGVLIVRDPGRFLTKLASGFGRAKAFGCGLMLIRRA